MRLRCWLFGCNVEGVWDSCRRCNREIEDDGCHYGSVLWRAWFRLFRRDHSRPVESEWRDDEMDEMDGIPF